MKGGVLEEPTTGISTILAGVDTITTLVGNVFDMIVSNPVLILFMAASLLGIGLGVFKKLKRASK